MHPSMANVQHLEGSPSPSAPPSSASQSPISLGQRVRGAQTAVTDIADLHLRSELHGGHNTNVIAQQKNGNSIVAPHPDSTPQLPDGLLSSVDDAARSRETAAVPAACLACRSKHLKCDGQTPCSRCVVSSFECVYVASRRGYKGPRRGTTANPNKRQATSPPETGADCPMLLGAGSVAGSMTTSTPSLAPFDPFSPAGAMSVASPAPAFNTPPVPTQAQLYRSYCSINGIDVPDVLVNTHPGPVYAQIPMPTLAEKCLDSFYHHFHASHPFVLPKDYLLRIAKEGGIEPLLAAIRWAGSLFIDVGQSRSSLFDEAYRLIHNPQAHRDGFLIQAMMVIIVALDGSCQQEKAAEILGSVETLAIQIGLNTRQFATLNGRSIPVLEESWRRTWWDLFIIDGMIAGVHRATNFLLFDIPADVALPCEEHQYLSGTIPQPLYLEDLEDREFSGDERPFSSFAYRILCGRNLGKFMRTPPIFGPEDENLARIEALLTNWRLHLPESKKDALQKDGKLDEMMFQAHMMMHATSILLHQPHSQLDSSPAQKITSCAPYQMVPAGDLFNAHTKHTIASATGISEMITHRVPLLSHTHFFTCVITLSSIVHLSRWALFFIPQHEEELRQQIRLNIGALNQLSQVWGAADRARGQVKGVAHEIYQLKKEQQRNPQFWLGFSQEEMINSIAADEGIINDIENLQATGNHLLG